MENQYSEIFTQIVENLLTVSELGLVSAKDYQKIYHVIIKTQLYKVPFLEKIKRILQTCNEYLLQSLWFNVFKKFPDDKIINLFQNEINGRNFGQNLWWHEIYQSQAFNHENESNLASSSGESFFFKFFTLKK